MEAPPATAFIVAEADFLLEVVIIALDAPAQLGDVDKAAERHVLVDGCEPEFLAPLHKSGGCDSRRLMTAAPSTAEGASCAGMDGGDKVERPQCG